MKISVLRDDRKLSFALILGESPQTPRRRLGGGPPPFPPMMRRPVLGIEVDQDLDDEVRRRLGAPAGIGLLVVRVQGESRAEEAGMKEGDLIVEALGSPLRTLIDLRHALREQGGREMIVKVIRDRREMTLEVPPAPPAPPAPQAPPSAPSPSPRRAPRAKP
jgi:serine protease Do